MTDPAQEGEEADHPLQISLSPRPDGAFDLRFAQGDRSVQIGLEPDQLPQLVGLLMSSSTDIASKLEDLDETPFLAVVNPLGKIERDDTGGIVHTFKSNGIRPFVMKLSRERAEEIHRALGACLRP